MGFCSQVLQMDRQHRALPPRRLSSTPIRRSGPAPPAGSEGSTCGADDLEEREAELPPHAFCFPPQADPPYDKRSYQDEEEEEEEEEEGGEESESTLNQDTVVFDDGDTWLEGAALGSANESGGPAGVALPPPTRTLSRKVSRAVGPPLPPPASQLMTRLFPSLKPKAQNAPLHPAEAPESRKSEETTGETPRGHMTHESLEGINLLLLLLLLSPPPPAAPPPLLLLLLLLLLPPSCSSSSCPPPLLLLLSPPPPPPPGQQLQSRQLRERLVQLEVEIRRFQEEQEELSRLRQQNEEQQEVLR